MADIIMVVTDCTKNGILDLSGNANFRLGDAAAGANFLFPNDGKVCLYVDGVTGDTFNFTAVADKYGRIESLGPVVAVGKKALIGPFMPDIWNDANGRVTFKPAVGNAGDILLAVRVANPS